MALDLKTIQIRPESELDQLLDEVEDRAFILERKGVHYFITRLEESPERASQSSEALQPPRLRVVEDTDIWAGYDPERLSATLRETIGVWRDVDTEQLKADLYRARREGSRYPVDE